MEKIKYKITKDKDFIGKRFESYTIEKIITNDDEEKECLYRIWFPFIDGDISKANLDEIYFPKPITNEEWQKLSPEYRKSWINGAMTEELHKELDELRLKEGVI